MKRIILVSLFLAAATKAQTVEQIGVYNISHGSARIVAKFSEAQTGEKIEWGLTPSYESAADGNDCGNIGEFVTCTLIGLPASSTIHYRIVTDSITGFDRTFDTLPTPDPHPALPTLPTRTTAPAMPEITGTTWTVGVDIGCDTLQECIDNKLVGLDDSLNYKIIVPASVVSYRVVFRDRPSHTGSVVIVSDAVDTGAFPPTGVRLTENWPLDSITAKVLSRGIGASGHPIDTLTAIREQACETSWATGTGGFVRVSNPNNSPGFFPVLRCTEDYAPYSGAATITAMNGSNPVTVTAPGHKLRPGNIINIPSNGYVDAGDYGVISAIGDTFSIATACDGCSFSGPVDFEIGNGVYWEHHNLTVGNGVPTGACADEAWYWDRDQSPEEGVYWCAEGVWTWRHAGDERPGDPNDSAFAAQILGNKYWISGLRFSLQQAANGPGGVPTGWDDCAGPNCYQGRIRQLVFVDGNNVTFDQNVFDGIGKPVRSEQAIQINGDNFTMMNSSVLDFHHWRTDYSYSQVLNGNAIKHGYGDEFLLLNNYVRCSGICYFGSWDYAQGTEAWGTPVASGIVIRRNTWDMTGLRETDTQPVAHTHRQVLEFKFGGDHILIEGNRALDLIANLTAGSFIHTVSAGRGLSGATEAISSFNNGSITTTGKVWGMAGGIVYVDGTGTDHDGLQIIETQTDAYNFTLAGSFSSSGSAGTVRLIAPYEAVDDLTVRDNSMEGGTEFARLTGLNVYASNFQSPPHHRTLFENNLVTDCDKRTASNGGNRDEHASANGFGCSFVFSNGHLEDLTLRHNTVYGIDGVNYQSFLWLYDDNDFEGLSVTDNISVLLGNNDFFLSSDGTEGEDALDQNYPQGWTATNNVICCGWGGDSGKYPPNHWFPSNENDVKWTAASLTAPFDFRLRPDSRYKSGGDRRATDDLDVGIDMDRLEKAQGRVRNTRHRSVTRNSATISYLAPDQDACVVEYSTSPVWGTGSRVSDGGGGCVRNVELTSLLAGTLYHYRVLCSVEQPYDSFDTDE